MQLDSGLAALANMLFLALMKVQLVGTSGYQLPTGTLSNKLAGGCLRRPGALARITQRLYLARGEGWLWGGGHLSFVISVYIASTFVHRKSAAPWTSFFQKNAGGHGTTFFQRNAAPRAPAFNCRKVSHEVPKFIFSKK